MDNDNGNDPAPAEQQDAPGEDQVRASWAAMLVTEAHHVGDTLLDAVALYGASLDVSRS